MKLSANILKAARASMKVYGYTQAQIARELGVSKSSLLKQLRAVENKDRNSKGRE